jgi:prephenate dehydrogenase
VSRAEAVEVRLGRVAIVGAGQIGTMLGTALRRSDEAAGVDEVGLFDAAPAVAEASLGRGAGHRILARERDVIHADTVVLALPVPEIKRAISEDTPEAADLRQNSPFAGLLSEPERRRIVDEITGA